MNKIKEPIKDNEYQVLMYHLKSDTKIRNHNKRNLMTIFTFLFHTGLRINEIQNLKVKDLISLLKDGFCYVYTNKTKQMRKLFVSNKGQNELKNLFEVYFKDDELEWNLIRPNNLPFEKFHKISLINQVNKYIIKVLGNNYSSHSFRIGLITDLSLNGGNPKVIQEIIGHKNIQTTLNYIKTTDNDKINLLNVR